MAATPGTFGSDRAGVPVDDVVPVALGDPGNAIVSFDVLSYAGTLSITVVADQDHVPDLPVLAAALQTELAAVGMGPATADPSG